MPRAKTEAPHGDDWVFVRGPNIITFEIWDGREYVPVYDNNGRPFDFGPELRQCRGPMQMRVFGEHIYKAGQ